MMTRIVYFTETRTEQVGLGNNVFDLCSGGAHFESHQVNSGIAPYIRPRPLPPLVIIKTFVAVRSRDKYSFVAQVYVNK
jgi:hypothetical protein